jgi:hypothetical protein
MCRINFWQKKERKRERRRRRRRIIIRNRANTIYLPNLLEGHKYIANPKRVVKWPVFLTSKIILSKFKF